MGTQPPPRKGAYCKHIQVLHKDQYRSLQSKHSQEILLLESVKSFFKQRFALEKQHFESLSKICATQYKAFECLKKLPPNDNNDIRSYDNNVFSIWIELLQSIEEKASNYYSLLQGLEKEILKDVKKLKTCKQQRIKKFNDRVSGIQKDVETSVTELDRTKRIYFSEESDALETAKLAEKADDIAKGRKKDVKSFFQSKTKLKAKAGNLDVKKDEVQIRSTGARNDYILSLATANAHQHQYFKNDLPEIMSLLEVQLYEKVQSYYNKYIDIELEKSRSNHEVFEILKGRTSATSRARNYEMFLVSYPSLSEHVTYLFENCPGDNIEKITTSEHDGGYSLNYEARQNASKLNQAVKTINAFEKRIEACEYHRSKGLTREPNDTGGPDLETKIVELQIAISNAKTDKAKAEARLAKLREGGIAVDEFIDAFVVERRRQQEAAEAQRARDMAAEAGVEAAEVAKSRGQEDQQENYELQQAQQPESWDDAGGWDDEPGEAVAPVDQSAPAEDNWATWDNGPDTAQDPDPAVGTADEGWAAFPDQDQSGAGQAEVVTEVVAEVVAEVEPISTEGLRQATVLYNFDSQNADELTITENEIIFISNEECDEEGWVVVINAQGQKGYVPMNYLDLGEEEENNGAEPMTNNVEETQPWAETSQQSQDYYRQDSFPMAAHPLDPPSAAPAISSQPPPWESAPMAAHPLDPPSAPAIPSQPPPWEASFEEDDSSEDEESEDEITNFSMGGPPPDMPPPIPDCPPPISEFSKSFSVDAELSISMSTFTTDYCVGIYDYDATGSDEISFRAGDKIKILNRVPNGVEDGWWKGMVKSSGKVGLFPCILCEPLEESDSEEKTEDSIDSPLSSCAPPNISPPKTPNPMQQQHSTPTVQKLSKNDTLDGLDPMEIVVTAPTPLVQSPTMENDSINGGGDEVQQEVVVKPVQPPRPPPAATAPPPAQPPRPPPAAAPPVPVEPVPAQPPRPPTAIPAVPQVVIQQDSEDSKEDDSFSSDYSEPVIDASTGTRGPQQPPPLQKQPLISSSDEEELMPQKTGSSNNSPEEEIKPDVVAAEESFPVNFPPLEETKPEVEVAEEFLVNFPPLEEKSKPAPENAEEPTPTPPVIEVDKVPSKQFAQPIRLEEEESSSEEAEVIKTGSGSNNNKKICIDEGDDENIQFKQQSASAKSSSSEDSFANLRNDEPEVVVVKQPEKAEPEVLSSPDETEEFPHPPPLKDQQQSTLKSSSDDESFMNLRGGPETGNADSDTESFPPPPPNLSSSNQNPPQQSTAEATSGLKRVDTVDSSESSSDSSEAEGPVGPAKIGAKFKSDDSSDDSSDHIPPEDLQVKQLKKLDMLKESSA